MKNTRANAVYRRVVASAPGKITLFGEHAVVYGKPAIVTAISRRIRVSVERGVEGIIISSGDLTVRGVEVAIGRGGVEARVQAEHAARLLSYVSTALRMVEERLDARADGLRVSISSDMPVSAGLGTSASVSVATIAAYMKLLGYEPMREEVARLGYMVEKTVQGAASPMDTAAASHGGMLLVEPWANPPYRPLRTASPGLPVIIGYIARSATTGELVANVRRLRDRYESIVDMVMETIAEITREAVKALLQGDLEALGLLMNMNHELLSVLGVSTPRLDELVNLARSSGALGAKLTGAGGGGAFIALCRSRDDVMQVARSIKAGGASVIEASLNAKGVVVEEAK